MNIRTASRREGTTNALPRKDKPSPGSLAVVSEERARRATSPAHVEISKTLREEIAAGVYDADSPLPTEATFCERFGASRFTVRQALETLVVDGLIYRQPGSGTFLTGLSTKRPYARVVGTIDDLVAIGEDTVLIPDHNMRPEQSQAAAARLDLSSPEVWVLRGCRARSGETFGYWEIFVPPEVGEMLGDLPTEGHTSVVAAIGAAGLEVARAEQEVTAEASDEFCARLLGVPSGFPLLRTERLFFDRDGRPVEWSISHVRTDRYTHRMELYSLSRATKGRKGRKQ